MSETPGKIPRLRRVKVVGPGVEPDIVDDLDEPVEDDLDEPVVRRSQRSKTARPTTGRTASKRTTQPSTSSNMPFILAGLVTVLILGGLAYVFLSSRNNTPVQGAVPTQTANSQAPGAQATKPAANATDNIPIEPANANPTGMFDAGQLKLPRGIAQDANGNFFVAETDKLRIDKFDKTGKFLTMFGSKGSGDAQFNPISDTGVGTGPGGVAVDKTGNVYVADTWNHRIEKFDNSGKFLTKWGSFLNLSSPEGAADVAKDTKFFGPRGVAVGPDGNIYVTDTGNKRVLTFDPNGKFVSKIDSGLTQAKIDAKYPFSDTGELNEPIGIAVDTVGNIYVADTHNTRIQKFDKAGKSIVQWPVPPDAWAPGPYVEPFVALDSAGNLYVTAPSSKTVLKYNPDGKLLGQKNKQDKATLQLPTGITVATDGTVYVVDTDANNVVNLGKIP